MSVVLTVNLFRAGQQVGQYQFDGGVERLIKIGKLASAHIHLDDPVVARIHAVIDMSSGNPMLIDMGSSAGTFVNGARINKYPLRSNEQIGIGSTKLVVVFEAAAATVAPAAATPRHPPDMRAPLAPPAKTSLTSPTKSSPTIVPAAPVVLAAAARAPAAVPAPAPASAPLQGAAASLAAKLAQLNPQQLTAVDSFIDALRFGGPSVVPQAGFGHWPSVDRRRARGTLSSEDAMIVALRRAHLRNQLLIGGGALVTLLLVVLVVTTALRMPAGRGAAAAQAPAAQEQSAPEQGAAPQPAAGGRDEVNFYYYTSKPGQKLSDVAEAVLWVPDNAKLIAAANPDLPPVGQPIDPGTVIKVPRYTSYTVVSGDSLGGIAKRLFDDESAREDLQAANKDILPNPEALDIGMVIRVPMLDPNMPGAGAGKSR